MENDILINEEKKKEVIVSYSDYKLIKKHFSNGLRTAFIVISILTLLFFLLGFTTDEPITFEDYLITNTIFIIGYAIIYKILDIITKRFRYKNFIKNNGAKYNLKFNEEYILKETKNKTEKIYYSDIKKIKENDLLLLLLLQNKEVVVIHKQDFNESELLHLKYMYDNTINNDNLDMSEYMEKTQKIDKKNSIIKILLIILFIACFLSIPLGMAIVANKIDSNNVSGFDFIKYTSGMFYALPIPVLSIILGFIYKNKGFKCTKNIVAGFIMSAILIIYGSFSKLDIFNFATDYQEFSPYIEIVSLDLPSEALEYQKIIPTSSYLEEHVWHIVKYQDNEMTNKLYQDIINSTNWITKEEISTNLNTFVVSSFNCSGEIECYYSVYNKELNAYNQIPTESGKYHIYSMFYDPNNKKLEIQEYSYNYKN